MVRWFGIYGIYDARKSNESETTKEHFRVVLQRLRLTRDGDNISC